MSNGRIICPNFTKTPNVIYDYWMCRLSGNEFKILCCICRKTFGWNISNSPISLKKLEELSGIAKCKIPEIIRKLIELDIVEKQETFSNDGDHSSNIYSLKVYDEEGNQVVTISNHLLTQSNHGSYVEEPPPLGTHTYTKDTLKKENITLTAEACELSSFFLEEIRKIKKDFKAPNLRSWSKTFSSMLEIQKRDYSAIKKVIMWSLNDTYWRPHVLSAAKINEKFDQLELLMLSSMSSSPKISNREKVLAILVSGDRCTHYEIDIGNDSVAFIPISSQGKSIVIKYSESGFIEQFNNLMKKMNWNKKI